MSKLLNIGRRQQKAGSLVQEDQGTYTFTCYVVGDHSAFLVSVPSTAKVGQLTREIHESGGLNRFNRSALGVIVWRVCQDWRAV